MRPKYIDVVGGMVGLSRGLPEGAAGLSDFAPVGWAKDLDLTMMEP